MWRRPSLPQTAEVSLGPQGYRGTVALLSESHYSGLDHPVTLSSTGHWLSFCQARVCKSPGREHWAKTCPLYQSTDHGTRK